MRITLFHTGFAEYVMGLANGLSDYADVTVIHPEALATTCSRLADSGVRLLSFEKPPLRRQFGNIPAMRRAFKLIEETRPDVVHVQETSDYAYDLVTAFRRIRPLVTTIHDVVPHPGDRDAAPGLQYTKAFGIWRSNRLIVHTGRMRERLSQRFKVNLSRIDVIPHGELGSLYKRLAEIAGKPAAGRDPYTLLFFGRIWPYKGLRFLLEAFSQIKREIPEAKLSICGRGGDLERNAGLLASLPDIEVRKTYIPSEDVTGLFERSSLVVLPYIEASQSGVSALGFPTGAVVVASRVGGLAEQIVDGRTGILVSPGNASELASAITRLLRDVKLQEDIRQAAAAYSSSVLDWKNIARSTMATYRLATGELPQTLAVDRKRPFPTS
jgi:glycosyltransferase involved in cell wall biosynthesis